MSVLQTMIVMFKKLDRYQKQNYHYYDMCQKCEKKIIVEIYER